MFLTFDNFEEIVVHAVNLGDDADTVEAVVGGLAEIFYGFAEIPPRLVEKLQNKEL
ncbi:MAG: ADP-ribosylglycohydrolase family protein [Bacillota bacterium]